MDSSTNKRLIALAEKGPTERFRTALAALPRPPDSRLLFAALRTALVWNQPEKVQLLLDAGADPLMTNGEGDQVLMHAAISGSGSLVAWMLSLGCDVNSQSVHNRTALHAAADAGNIEGVRVLLDAGADPDSRDARNVSPLMAALAAGREECALELIHRGADVRSSQPPQRETPLMAAAGSGAAEAVRLLLEMGADPDSRDFQGCTALMYAARSGTAEAVRLLLEAGADRDALDDVGMSALLWVSSLRPEISALLDHRAGLSPDAAREVLLKASLEGNIPMMRSLLDQGVEIQPSREGGESALAQAVFSPSLDALALLLDHPGCMIDYRHGNMLQTPLIVAARTGEACKVRMLCERGADLTITDAGGGSAVNHAAIRADVEILALLRQCGAAVDHRDTMGRTPLHNAIHATSSSAPVKSRRETVRWLLQAGLDPDTADNAGMTPLMYAAEEASADTVSLLLAAGARTDTRDDQGRSALMHALWHGTDYGLNERYVRPRTENEDPAVPVIRLLLGAGVDPEGGEALACARHWRWSGTVGLLRAAARRPGSPRSESGRRTKENA